MREVNDTYHIKSWISMCAKYRIIERKEGDFPDMVGLHRSVLYEFIRIL